MPTSTHPSARGLAFASVLLLAGAAALPGARVSAQPSGGVLQVNVVGFRGRAGRALVALYDSADGWLDISRARQVVRRPIRGGALFVQFDDVPRGRDYAVSVIHDANRNDRMDMSWLPIPHPAEGAGASRNPRPSMGPPGWDSARFRFDADRRIVVTLTY